MKKTLLSMVALLVAGHAAMAHLTSSLKKHVFYN